MKFGLVMFPTDTAIQPAELGRAAEERGFESIWFPEHTHIPASRRSPWPGGSDLPEEYWHTHDPFVALTAVAAVTTRIKVATGICLIVERDPITTAKEVASLDMISGGRFIFGIGAGWNAEEMEHHGAVFKDRWKIVREKIEAMKAIWTKDEPEYHGRFVDFEKIWSWPKPVQKPHPPIILGSETHWARQRVVEYGDGWMPIFGLGGDLPERVEDLRERARKVGRDPQSISLSMFGAPADKDAAKFLADLGFERLVLPLRSAPADKVLPRLDRYASFISELGG
jgi:probable F420-dependent oxidoreductase